jgi:hypothetical protein
MLSQLEDIISFIFFSDGKVLSYSYYTPWAPANSRCFRGGVRPMLSQLEDIISFFVIFLL